MAYYALALYAGVRPDELSRITWASVKFENDGSAIVIIDAAASKVRRRRIVELEPTAVEWLRKATESNGRLPVTISTRRRYHRQAAKVLGFESWPQDCLRHTAASYLLAHHRDAGKVAYQLGNSIKILETHYKGLVMRNECSEFWAFKPDSPRPEKPKPTKARVMSAPVIPESGLNIDRTMSRFARAEAALAFEPVLRRLGKQRQQLGAYHGGVTGRPLKGDRVDTILEVGRIAGCSRQTVQYVKVLLQKADPDVLDKLRNGKVSIHGQYKKVLAQMTANPAV